MYETMKDQPPLVGGEIGKATESCPANAEEALVIVRQEAGGMKIMMLPIAEYFYGIITLKANFCSYLCFYFFACSIMWIW